MVTKTHHFFLLANSPWPLVSRISAFNLLFSLLIFLKYSNPFRFLFCIIRISLVSSAWWNNYTLEFRIKGFSSFLLEIGIKFAIILFISSEIFFFFSFFWSYFHFNLSPTMQTGLNWPPLLVEAFDCLNVPLINTLTLLRSGLTVTLSHFFLISGNSKNFKFYLFISILLGIFFSFLQIMEYKSSFFGINDGSFGTVFFILTGFHGIHVIIGTVYLLCTLIRSLKFNFSQESSLSFEIASWYWHFVDVVWIFLYFFLYYANN